MYRFASAGAGVMTEKDVPTKKIPQVFTIKPSSSFLDSVAKGVLDQTDGDPLKLSDYTILVPDRDTGVMLRRAFMEAMGGKPSIMPKIYSPGDMDDDSLSLRISGNPVLSQTLMDIPPAVSPLERQLVLAREILKIKGMASSVQKAVKLGGELGLFLDEAQRHGIDLHNVDSLVPLVFRMQWTKTSEFLKILTETWPQHLEKVGMVDPEEHKNALIRIQAAQWQLTPPDAPLFAVGFTDMAPAVIEMLQTVASLKGGSVILPGVDLELDEKSWNVLGPVHPQYAFRRILEALPLKRGEVQEWAAQEPKTDMPRSTSPARTNEEREILLREALRPAGTAEGWSNLGGAADKKGRKTSSGLIDKMALNGMDLITCGSPQEEASVIALKMRETLETPGKTATLVTSDRSLARRVSARLRQWGIEVADSAGTPLSSTPAGIYLLATAKMSAEEWSPIPLLEALKHPLAALGEKKIDFQDKVSALEDRVLHGPRPDKGAEGMKGALSAAFNRAARRPDLADAAALEAEKQKMEAFLQSLETSGKPFFDKMASKMPLPFQEFLDEHIRFAEALAKTDSADGADRIWRGDDGVKATRFLTKLRAAAKHMPDVTGGDYVDVLQGLMREVNVRPSSSFHPLLKILPPEQAQLAKADVIIIGGLNDDVWPPRVAENPWLSPDMIKALGLPPPEKSIGTSARDFVQMASSPNVLLCRAVRDGDSPTVSSPFLTRLMMVLKGAGLEQNIEGKTQLLAIHTAIHTPKDVTPVEPPEPRPPSHLRPKRLPVTAIEGLMRDPYSVYARYVLKLRPKPPIDASPTVSERGTFTHAALDAFVKKYPDKMPDNAYEELLKIGEEAFKTRISSPAVQSFWWPRFERIAKWFVKFETERRELTKTLGTEVRGKLEIDLGSEMFTLTAIADRIDMTSDDTLSIIDYKTGAVPLQKSVALGLSPQLTLEALIAFTGGFDKIDAGDVGQLQYWKLSGGKPAAEVTEVKGEIKKLVNEAREGVTNLAKTFNDSNTPYLSTPRPEHAPRYNNYLHLSRVGEWSTVRKTADKKQKKKPKLKEPETKKIVPKKGGKKP